jgi:Generalcontrol nonderepressible 1 (Gcn1) N-terminal
MLLRSPEICLPGMHPILYSFIAHGFLGITKFYISYKHPLTFEELKRLSTPILSSTKSTNASVRAEAINLFESILSREFAEDDTKQVIESILSPVITGKSAGPDHRQALYAILACIPASTTISTYLVQTLLPLMEKETNDNNLFVLSDVLPKHMVFTLRNVGSFQLESLNIMAKEMGSTKASSKKAMTLVAGQTFWRLSHEEGIKGTEKLLESLRPILEKNLKDSPTTSLAGSGPVDAWVTIVILLSFGQGSPTCKMPIIIFLGLTDRI